MLVIYQRRRLGIFTYNRTCTSSLACPQQIYFGRWMVNTISRQSESWATSLWPSAYMCVCATRWISEGGRLHCATGLAWQNVSATSYEISLSLYALICAYPNSYDVRDSSCVVMVVFVAALGSHSFSHHQSLAQPSAKSWSSQAILVTSLPIQALFCISYSCRFSFFGRLIFW